MSASYIKINFNIGNSNKIIYSKNIKNKRVCWFCQIECHEFVSICENCKYEKFTKNKKNDF